MFSEQDNRVTLSTMKEEVMRPWLIYLADFASAIGLALLVYVKAWPAVAFFAFIRLAAILRGKL